MRCNKTEWKAFTSKNNIGKIAATANLTVTVAAEVEVAIAVTDRKNK